jgi:hypothetical protein
MIQHHVETATVGLLRRERVETNMLKRLIFFKKSLEVTRCLVLIFKAINPTAGAPRQSE